MPQGAKGAFPERGAAAPMNAPEAHLRSAALAAPILFRTLVARAQLRSDTQCHQVPSMRIGRSGVFA